MSANVNVKLYFKGVTYALLGVVVAVLGVIAVGVFMDYFEVNPFNVMVKLSTSLGIDVFGAVIPIVVGLIAAALFIKFKFPIKKLAIAIVSSVLLAFLICQVTADGVVGYSLLFAIVASAVVAAVNVFPKPFVDLKKNFVASLMLTLVCVPLSLTMVDLFYSSYFANAVIGGKGLSDGVLISTLYVPISVTGVFSVLMYVSQTTWLVGRYLTVSTIRPRERMNTVVSEVQNSQA